MSKKETLDKLAKEMFPAFNNFDWKQFKELAKSGEIAKETKNYLVIKYGERLASITITHNKEKLQQLGNLLESKEDEFGNVTVKKSDLADLFGELGLNNKRFLEEGEGMIYKTQVFTEQQLKDGVKGLEVVTAEPVKKGDVVKVIRGKEIREVVDLSGGTAFEKIIFKVGELVQAVNEKGEKQWYCPTCFKSWGIISEVKRGVKIWDWNKDCEKPLKPLLFRLIKIDGNGHTEIEYWLKSWKAKK